jgi:hypothetical protein
MATPAAEVDIDESLVRSLLADQQPSLAGLPIRVVANGWDNAIAQLGDEFMVRLPRREAAAQLIVNEQRWLPVLAPALPLPIPTPFFAGQPSASFPWAWSVCPWLPGKAASVAPPTDPHAAAVALAEFVVACTNRRRPTHPTTRTAAFTYASVPTPSCSVPRHWGGPTSCRSGTTFALPLSGHNLRCGSTAICTRRTCSRMRVRSRQ